MTEPKSPVPYAVCRNDGEPLVSTFEFPQFEFVCVACGRKYGFLEPAAAEATPELDARHAELREQYDRERAERRAAAEASS